MKRTFAVMLFTLAVTASDALAAPPSLLRISVDANGVARHASPVVAQLTVGKDVTAEQVKGFAKHVEINLKEGDKPPMPAQAEVVEGADGKPQAVIVRWVEPNLTPDKPKTYDLSPAEAVPTAAFKFSDGDGYRDLSYGDNGVYRYMLKYDPADHANTFKPYHHVFGFHDNDRADFITKGPGGKYTHHRGIFFGFNKTQFGDFWHCPDVSQRHDKFLADREFTGPVAARAASIVNWVSKDEQTHARDTREVTAWHVADDVVVLDYDITVESLATEPLQLHGDAHHSGFHFRAAQEVADVKTDGKETGMTYTRPEGAVHKKDDVWENENWAHGVFTIKGNPYAVTHFDAPTNFRPIQYSTRAYGRFGSFFVTEVPPIKPLHLRYRLIIRDGKSPIDRAQLEREYKDFGTPVKVSVAQ